MQIPTQYIRLKKYKVKIMVINATFNNISAIVKNPCRLMLYIHSSNLFQY